MLDYCPNKGKQNNQRARVARNKNPHTSHKRTNNRRGTNHRSYTPNVGKNTRTHAPYSTVSLPPSTSRGTRTRTPNRATAFEAVVSTNSTTLAKEKGSGNKHEQQPRDHSAPNQRDTRTPAAPPASPTRVRGHSQPAHPDRPNLLTNTESTLTQTPKRHPHTPSAPPMPPHTPA